MTSGQCRASGSSQTQKGLAYRCTALALPRKRPPPVFEAWTPHRPASYFSTVLISKLLHHSGLRPLAFLVMLLDSSLHAVIADRQNIRMPQGEHQEHVRRPDADAFDLSKMRNHFLF